MSIELLSNALALKLIASIADDADEGTLKFALLSFPALIAEALEEAMKLEAGT